jgi:transposase-like protein
MEHHAAIPKTLQGAIIYFANPDRALAFMVQMRWPDGVICPYCGGREVTFLSNQRRWKCRVKHPRQQFSVKVGTIFEDSPIGLEKWLPALWMIVNDKNGISSYEVGRALGVTQKTGWFMLHRIRLAMQERSLEMLRGQVEADETYIGGSVRFMHKSRLDKLRLGGKRQSYAKAVVMGLLERGGRVRAQVIAQGIHKPKKADMLRVIDANVEPGSEMITDSAAAYRQGLTPRFLHSFINHVESYVDGHVHTNSIENFWTLLKRALKGTYVNVEPFHLHRYVDEQAFRFNERRHANGDGGRFVRALRSVLGRRLTYKELTGAVATT